MAYRIVTQTVSPGLIRVGARDDHLPHLDDRDSFTRQVYGSGRVQYFRDIRDVDPIEEAIIEAHGVEIRCRGTTEEELIKLDNTLLLVPPRHLEQVNTVRPRGFVIQDRRGGTEALTGGTNRTGDIIITHGAFYVSVRSWTGGICPTVMHEIGHVMTHGGRISYAPFRSGGSALQELADQLVEESTSGGVSSNQGELEGLCNAYMYFLCFAASQSRSPRIDETTVRRFGTGEAGNIEKSPLTRTGLRRCRAFQPEFLAGDNASRFDER